MEEEKLSGKEKKKGLSIFKKKEIWVSGIVGILIGALLIYILSILGVPGLGNETIASIKGEKLTKNELYKEIRKMCPIDYVLESIDKLILENKYSLTEEQEQEINDKIDYMINQYSEEYIFSYFGVETKEELVDYMKFDYKRNLYFIDYFKTQLSDEEIQNYYNENEVYGEINTKHILVQVSDDVTEEQALATANEIIAKLNNGTSFDDVATEYEDKIVTENVDFDSFNAESLAEAYVEASKVLEKGTYTTEPVKTDYGYHIIYCIDKKDKPSFEQAENDIVEKLGETLEEEDPYIIYKALIKLREDNGLKFKDSKFEKEYQEYCEQVNSAS